MRVYSPSQTAAHCQCPMYRALQNDGWRALRLTPVDRAATLGKPFAVGMKVWYLSRRGGCADTPAAERAADLAQEAVRATLREYETQGRTPSEAAAADWERLPEMVGGAVKRYCAQDPVPPEWEVVGVEETLRDWGWCRIDLGLRTPNGLVVADHKVKITYDARGAERARYQFQYDEWGSRNHYTFAYEQAMGEPVNRMLYYVVGLQPRFKVDVLEFVVTPEERQTWLDSARARWADMEAEDAGTRVVQMVQGYNTCSDCAYRTACHEHHHDTNLMGRSYAQAKRRN